MKKLFFLITLIMSVILISCSETINEPAGGNTEKASVVVSDFPYEYLQRFEEIQVSDWNLPNERSGDIAFTIDRKMEEIEDLFVIVYFGDPQADTEGVPVLFFIHPEIGNQTVRIPLQSEFPFQIKKIEAYILVKVSETEQLPPYENAHAFGKIDAGYEVSGNELVISPVNSWSPEVSEVYAHIHMPNGNELVYLQLPDNNSKISIPGYEGMEVTGVQLFLNYSR